MHLENMVSRTVAKPHNHALVAVSRHLKPADPDEDGSLSLAQKRAIILQAKDIWEESSRDDLTIASENDPCCNGTLAGNIDNMLLRKQGCGGTWVRAWVWVEDCHVLGLRPKKFTPEDDEFDESTYISEPDQFTSDATPMMPATAAKWLKALWNEFLVVMTVFFWP